MTRVVIAGGGTGGHLYPGLAVAEVLRERGVAVDFIGSARGIETRAVPREGYPLHLIPVSGLLRVDLLTRLRGLLRLPLAAVETLRLLRRLRPDVVVGVGGYASGPVVALAALTGTPTAILEQNSVPGRTNRILSRLVRQSFLAFAEAADHFPPAARPRATVAGNPIRRGLLRAAATPVPSPDGRPRLLILGGSQGAHAVNERVIGAIELLARQRSPLPRIDHQSGAADAEALTARYRALGLTEADARVRPFIDDMGAAYAAADLVVGRAGATTLAELCALGLPALLIPFPGAADDHQTRNAEALERAGAARLLPQASTDAAALANALAEVLGDEPLRRRMAAKSRTLGQPRAAEDIAEALLRLA